MRIHAGSSLTYAFVQPTPVLAIVSVHPTRAHDLVAPEVLRTWPDVPVASHVDPFGNLTTRLVAPAGEFRLQIDSIVEDDGLSDLQGHGARQTPIEALPADALPFLLPSRYCESDRLLQTAWDLFGTTPEGWPRVQAVNDWVHDHVTFGYEHARPTKSAWETFNEAQGVCRDFAHLGVAFCRALNIPARYCTGYVSDVGAPPTDAPMDFAGWFEVHLDGTWYTVDPRNHVPRIGRILVARGRDAADVAITSTFGPNVLVDFRVWTDPVEAEVPQPV